MKNLISYYSLWYDHRKNQGITVKVDLEKVDPKDRLLLKRHGWDSAFGWKMAHTVGAKGGMTILHE